VYDTIFGFQVDQKILREIRLGVSLGIFVPGTKIVLGVIIDHLAIWRFREAIKSSISLGSSVRWLPDI
jgi:hypothetical protein